MGFREVVHIQVGQCGNQVGTQFWELIAQEHGLTPDGTWAGQDPVQTEKIDVFYREGLDGYVPRAVLVDMENTVLNHIGATTYGQMFHLDNYITSKDGAANCFMQGYYSDDANMVSESVMQVLRKQIERANCPQGFTFSHSSGGGAGSGLCMKIFSQCEDLLIPSYGGTWFFTVFPSKKISNTVIEPYNTALVLDGLRDAKNVTCLDNESMYSLACNTLGLESPTFADLNRLVANVMAGNTASFRFPGQLNTDMNKLSYSLRTRPLLHYYVPSFAPLTSSKSKSFRKLTVSSLVKQMTDETQFMCDLSPLPEDEAALKEKGNVNFTGKIFSYAALFRGPLTTKDVDECMTFIQPISELEDRLRKTLGYKPRVNIQLQNLQKTRSHRLQSTRQNFTTITNYSFGSPMQVTYLQNTTRIKLKFLKILRKAITMYNSTAFTHWFKSDDYKNYDGARSLPDALRRLSQEWIHKFGEEDTTEYPEAVEFGF